MNEYDDGDGECQQIYNTGDVLLLLRKHSNNVSARHAQEQAANAEVTGESGAGMVQVVLPAEKETDLRNALSKLETDDFKVSVIDAGDSEKSVLSPAQRIHLEVVGQDRQGIVAAISQTIAAQGINVVELATDCRNAPWSGDKVFQTNALLEVPPESSFQLDDLRDKIEEIAGDLMVEIKPEIS